MYYIYSQIFFLLFEFIRHLRASRLITNPLVILCPMPIYSYSVHLKFTRPYLLRLLISSSVFPTVFSQLGSVPVVCVVIGFGYSDI